MQEIILDISNNDDVVDFVNKMFYIVNLRTVHFYNVVIGVRY